MIPPRTEFPSVACVAADVSEGIENLIFRAAQSKDSFQAFMEAVKSKRYTWTRIQRMLTHILTGFTKEMRDGMEETSYLRLLGMTNDGRLFLNGRKKNLPLPLVSKVSSFSDPSLDMDIAASDIYALALGIGTSELKIGKDFQSYLRSWKITCPPSPLNNLKHHQLW